MGLAHAVGIVDSDALYGGAELGSQGYGVQFFPGAVVVGWWMGGQIGGVFSVVVPHLDRKLLAVPIPRMDG